MTQTLTDSPDIDELIRGERHAPALRRAEHIAEQIPVDAYIGATGASILASIGLYLMGHKHGAIFVGLWAPTIINLALLTRLVRPSER
ncbi:hypothetical protein BH23CHL9_BH23CHL9_00620 [soil metagenome]|jgi:hypothetical protein